MGIIKSVGAAKKTILAEKPIEGDERYATQPDRFVDFAGGRFPCWDEDYPVDRQNAPINNICHWCNEPANSKPAADWNTKSIPHEHLSCAFAHYGISLTNKTGIFTGIQSEDGTVTCEAFKRKERKRGRAPVDALCECGRTKGEHGTGSESDEEDLDSIPLEIINPEDSRETLEDSDMKTKNKAPKATEKAPKATEKAGKVIKLNVGNVTVTAPNKLDLPVVSEAPKAPEKPKAATKVAKATKVVEKPAEASKAPEKAPEAPKAPTTTSAKPPTREEILASVKANPKASHRFLGAGRGKPAVTAQCVGCGAEWQNDIHDKSPRN